ncbi:hypothetical protein KY285_020838 [Solanum tuberosum]|nr:hypothetical protein KY285_020838 [Solanum tuberosum]
MVTNAKLRELVRRVEAFVGITDERMDDPTLVDILTQIIGLRLDTDKFQGEINVYRNDIDEHMAENLIFREVTTLQLEGLQKENENLRTEIIILCRANLKAFSGARSAKELENFIWDMEQYFTAARVPETDKLNITAMYLTGDAKLW